MNVITKEARAIIQSGLNTHIPNAIGTDSTSAVKADNCCGERFFVLNIFLEENKEQESRIKKQGTGSKVQGPGYKVQRSRFKKGFILNFPHPVP